MEGEPVRNLCAEEHTKLGKSEHDEYEAFEPTVERDAPKVFLDQRLLICTATYQEPVDTVADVGSGGKMCVSNINLQYGSRAAFIHGLDDLIAKPVLTMAMEFERNHEWVDWKDGRYTLREE
jgi:hypothetical protein